MLLEKEQAVRRAHQESAAEISLLKDTIQKQRHEMENLQFERQEELQQNKATWSAEVNQLSNTS